MPVIPSGAPASLPVFQIFCNGNPFPISTDLIGLDVVQAMDGSGNAILRFSALSAGGGWDTALQLAPLGAVLEVALGYHTQVQSVFTGLVRAHRLSLLQAGAPEMVLEASSHAAPAVRNEEVALTAQYGATLLAFEAGRTLMNTSPATTGGNASRVQGQATLSGTTAAHPGDLLALRGVGDAFSGNVRITAVHHVFSRGGWTTRVDFAD